MHILLINPNSTASMTTGIEKGIAEELERDLGVPVVDPVVAAVKLADVCGLVRRGRRAR